MRSPSRSTTQLVAPRGLSTRPTPIVALRAAGLGGGRARRAGRAGASSRSNVCRSSSARCSSRAWTSPAARSGDDRLEAVVGEARAASRATSSATPGGARRRPDGAEARGVVGVDDADVGQPVLERGVEEQLAPAALPSPSRDRGELARARRATVVGVERRARCRRRGRVPKRKRWPVSAAFSRRARSVSAAKRLLPAARPTPAQTAAMSLRWLHSALELEQDRARARELGVGEAERLLAGVRVGDAVRDRAGGAGARGVRRARRRASRPRPRARGRGACRRGARRGGGSGRRRRGSGSGRTRSRRRGSARPRPGRRRRRARGTVQRSRSRSWSTSGRSGSWPSKRDAVEVVRLALVPAGGRERGRRSSARGRPSTRDRLEPRRRRPARRAACARRRRRRWRAGRRSASRSASAAAIALAVRAHAIPSHERVDDRAPGQPERRRGEREQQRTATRGERRRRRAGRAPGAVAPRAALPAVVSSSACASPRKPSASRTAARRRGPRRARPGSRRRRSAPR